MIGWVSIQTTQYFNHSDYFHTIFILIDHKEFIHKIIEIMVYQLYILVTLLFSYYYLLKSKYIPLQSNPKAHSITHQINYTILDPQLTMQNRKISQNSQSKQQQTPVKKWLRMSPLEDKLAIIQSEESEQIQCQLFNELIGRTPSFHEQNKSQSSLYQSDSVREQQQSCEWSQSNPSMDSDTVNKMKVSEQKTAEKLLLKLVDSNRKGCNCKNSKCQKNYCQCLRMGVICSGGLCSCEDCHNTEQTNIHKINNQKMMETKYNSRGCNCKKSKCLKKYCQCHSEGRKCSSICQCIECLNQDENEDRIVQNPRKLRKGLQTEVRV